ISIRMSTDPEPQNSAELLSEEKMPLIAYALYIIGVIFPLLTLAGLILAYLKRGEAPEWHKGHYTYLIRTFWIGLLISFVGLILTFVGIGVLVLIACGVWYLVRTIKGLLRFNSRRPIDNPTTWLI
ncbi:DUF4870 family protein, partial [Rhodovulum sulfidophilum]|uniref:DUF4870 family protein n=2 Tax=Rhodovulum sulfidophilum TaxID=35806 RepID=UPI001F3F9419